MTAPAREHHAIAPLSIGTAAAVTIALVVLGLLAAFAHRQLLFFDDPVREAVDHLYPPLSSTLLTWVGHLGSRILIWPLTLIAAVLTWRRCPQLAVLLVGVSLTAVGIELLMKTVVDRPRPSDVGFGASFPSGHVVAAVAWWGLLPAVLYVATKRRWLWMVSLVGALVIVIGVGISRVQLSAHWPSDILGGVLLGIVFLAVAEWAIRRPWPRLRCEACVLHREYEPEVREGP